MYKIRLWALMLAFASILSIFAGCNEDVTAQSESEQSKTEQPESKKEQNSIDGETQEEDKDDSISAEWIGVEHPVKVQYDGIPEGLTAAKIGSSEHPVFIWSEYGYICATTDGKEGLMKLNGQMITDLIYDECSEVGSQYNYDLDLTCYKVSTAEPTNPKDPASVNCRGLIDCNGEELLPMKYADFERISDRFIRVYEATALTDNPDKAVLYEGGSWSRAYLGFDAVPIFEAKWYIYDIFEHKMLDSITGTTYHMAYGAGKYVQYTTDSGAKVIIDAEGNQLPSASVTVFSRGYYVFDGAVYDLYSNFLFTCPDGYRITSAYDGFFSATHGKNAVMLDMSGNVISAEFSSQPKVRRELLIVDDHLYRFDGSLVVDGEISQVYNVTIGEHVYIVEYDRENGKEYQVITSDGTVWGEFADPDEVIDISQGIIRFDGDTVTAYCYQDRDFTIENVYCRLNMWLVSVENADGTHDLVETVSGKTLLTGYESYLLYERAGYAMYVEASCSDGTYDFYIIK